MRVLRRRWPSGLAVFAGVFGLVAALVLFATPVYRAEARLRLGEAPPMGGVSPNAGFFGFLRLGGDPFANELELLDSRTLVEGVVSDAVLSVVMTAPNGWPRDSFLLDLTAGRATDRATFRVAWQPDGRIAVRMTSPVDSLIGSGSPGESVSFGGVAAVFRAITDDAHAEIEFATLPFGDAVRRTQDRIVVERTRRDANVVRIAYDDPDAGLAERVVASVVDRYLELRTAIQQRESGITVDSLRGVAALTFDDLTRAEAALQAYQERTRFIAPEDQSAAFVERYSELAAALSDAEAQVDAVDRLLRRADGAAARTDTWSGLVSYPRFLQNPTIGAVLEQLIQLEQRRTELTTRRTEANREARVLNEQIATLDSTLRSLVHGYRAALVQEITTLAAQLTVMDSTLVGVASLSAELGRRRRSVRMLSEVYLLTEQRLRQEELREALTFANVQVIDPPLRQFKPVWPRKRLGLVVGFLLAGVFGALAVAVHERADQTVRSAREVREVLDAPVLMTVVRSRRGVSDVATFEASALVRRAGGPDGPTRAVALTGLSASEHAVADLARALTETGIFNGVGPASGQHGSCRLSILPPVAGFRGAAQAATADGPVVLVIEWGKTTRAQLARAGQLLRENGARVAGAVVLCTRLRQAAELWL